MLVDTSASMGKPFAVSAAASPFQGSLEEETDQTKLDAVKEMVLKPLYGLSNTDVAITSFADEAHLAWKGRAKEVHNATDAILSLAPGGKSNLAQALLLALHRIASSSPYTSLRFLIITDGLSNVGDPVRAADECRESYLPITINTILIDQADVSSPWKKASDPLAGLVVPWESAARERVRPLFPRAVSCDGAPDRSLCRNSLRVRDISTLERPYNEYWISQCGIGHAARSARLCRLRQSPDGQRLACDHHGPKEKRQAGEIQACGVSRKSQQGSSKKN
jgi:hypothetical protein